MKKFLYLFFALCFTVGMISCNVETPEVETPALDEAAEAAKKAAEEAAAAAAAAVDSLAAGVDSLKSEADDALKGLEGEDDGEKKEGE